MSIIDIKEAFKTQPKPQDFILPGFLAGTVGAVVAPGATGKSFWAMQLACLIADKTAKSGEMGFSLGQRGRVHYLSLEDPVSELHRRLYAIGRSYDEEIHESIAENFTLQSRVGQSFDIMQTDSFSKLVEVASGARLIVIDTLSRAHTLDENNNNEMSQLLVQLDAVCVETGASLLFLHHTSKAAVLNGQGGTAQASRGASSLIDNARWCGSLVRMGLSEAKKYSIKETDICNYVKFEMPKVNYDKNQFEVWYRREEGGLLSALTLDSKVQGQHSQDAPTQNNETGFRRKQNAL